MPAHECRNRGRASPLRDRPSKWRSEEHTSELQSRLHLVCRLLLEKKKKQEVSGVLERVPIGHARETVPARDRHRTRTTVLPRSPARTIAQAAFASTLGKLWDYVPN